LAIAEHSTIAFLLRSIYHQIFQEPLMAMQTPVAILGLGIMGGGMASRLLSKGFAVTVYNRSPQKAEALRSLGATVAHTPREAVANAMFVLSMLSDDTAARQIWLGPDGALAGAMRGAILIESSTVTIDWVKELSTEATKHGCEFLDAPVTGSKNHAAAGELTFLVGGSDKVVAKASEVLSAMSKEIVHLGSTGSGALMKLINNFVCGVQVVALGEGIAAIERSTMDRDKAVGVLTNGAPGSPLVKMIAARMLAKNYDPNFMLKLVTKDLRYARDQVGATEVGNAAIRTFERAIDAGLGDKDFAAVVELLRHNSQGTK
jgi:3-hydroxyisobutyrate dehydrogenase